MSALFRLCGAALLFTAAASLLKEKNRSVSTLVSVAAFVVLFFGVSEAVSEIVSFVKKTAEGTSSSSYVPVLLKAVAFTFLAEVVSGICRAAGEEKIASVVSIACRCEILALSIPYLTELLNFALGMLK